MPIEKRDVERILKGKFAMQPAQGKHYILWYILQGKQHLATHTSWGKTKYKTLSDDLLSKMARNLHLTLSQFKQGLDCTLEKGDWDRIIKNSLGL